MALQQNTDQRTKGRKPHTPAVNTVGMKFNHWTVIEELGKGKVRVRCDCEAKTEGIRYKSVIISGKSKSCGCLTPGCKTDLLNKTFGHWKVIGSAGNGYCLCECDCENHTRSKVARANLLNGTSTSCGCKLKQTMYREVHELEHDSLVDLLSVQSQYEDELVEIIKSIDSNIKIIRSDRKILDENELDIYLPEKKIAIEFNGTYWHSTIHKDKNYHQEKTLKAFSLGIHLIHIFEYEWVDENKKRLLIQYITDLISSNKVVYYARKCEIKQLDNRTERQFENNYHLQGYANSKEAYGLYYNNELISVMSFGEPRFERNYSWELIRYCVKSGCTIIGGKEKLLKHFLDSHDNADIITYVDISKFTGLSYFTLGFKKADNWKTQPGYVWVSSDSKDVLSRYKTQKHALVEAGLGTEDETEDTIMNRQGYYKVYNSGNLKLEYMSK